MNTTPNPQTTEECNASGLVLLNLDLITADAGTQSRAAISEAVICDYKERMEAGDVFPPLDVFCADGRQFFLVDGFHRYLAAHRIGVKQLHCAVHKGSERDALWFALGANKAHGTRPSPADKKYAIERALAKFPDKTQAEIAAHVGCSQGYVARVASEFITSNNVSPFKTRKGKDGKNYPASKPRKKTPAHAEPATVQPDQYQDAAEPTVVTNADEIGEAVKSTPAKNWLTLAEWDAMDPKAQAQALTVQPHHNATFNAQTSDSIEWARWSWNPITGCNHGCKYCYARDIANRFYPQKFEPSIVPSRLAAPSNTKQKDDTAWSAVDRMGHRNVFTCSMADLFGNWVPSAWIEAVLEQVSANPQWNFLFLTKFPTRMAEFEFPDNAWVGTTVDNQAAVLRAEAAFSKVRAGLKWLSCEPLMEDLVFSSLRMFDWVVVGGATRSTQTDEFKPPFAWIDHLYQQATKAGCKVYMKTNLLGNRVREYPTI